MSFVLFRKTIGAAGLVMATVSGANQTSESFTWTAPAVPTAWTRLEPEVSATGHVKMLLRLERVPCEAPLRNNSTVGQLA